MGHSEESQGLVPMPSASATALVQAAVTSVATEAEPTRSLLGREKKDECRSHLRVSKKSSHQLCCLQLQVLQGVLLLYCDLSELIRLWDSLSGQGNFSFKTEKQLTQVWLSP